MGQGEPWTERQGAEQGGEEGCGEGEGKRYCTITSHLLQEGGGDSLVLHFTYQKPIGDVANSKDVNYNTSKLGDGVTSIK